MAKNSIGRNISWHIMYNWQYSCVMTVVYIHNCFLMFIGSNVRKRKVSLFWQCACEWDVSRLRIHHLCDVASCRIPLMTCARISSRGSFVLWSCVVVGCCLVFATRVYQVPCFLLNAIARKHQARVSRSVRRQRLAYLIPDWIKVLVLYEIVLRIFIPVCLEVRGLKEIRLRIFNSRYRSRFHKCSGRGRV